MTGATLLVEVAVVAMLYLGLEVDIGTTGGIYEGGNVGVGNIMIVGGGGRFGCRIGQGRLGVIGGLGFGDGNRFGKDGRGSGVKGRADGIGKGGVKRGADGVGKGWGEEEGVRLGLGMDSST